MNGLNQRTVVLLGITLMICVTLLGSVALADPINPLSKDVRNSGRGTVGGSPVSIDAQAGNVTAVNIHGETLTDVWQGFYGNITGSITLENAGGAVFYNWSLAQPTGEIYTARISSPTWSNVVCANLTHIQSEESMLSINDNKADGINETFTWTTHDAFTIGSTSFVADYCNYTTNGFNGTGAQNVSWDEIMLWENGSSAPVFATIIGQNFNAFDGNLADFETLVPTNTTLALTTYYFFVELN